MALIYKFYSLMFLLVLFFTVLEESSGCNSGQKCFKANAASLVDVKSRKVLVALRGDLLGQRGGTGNGEKLEIRELRAVPSGPDPLHHNGGSPKKPITP